MMSFESSDNIDISRNVTLNSSGGSEINTSHSSSDDTINVSNNNIINNSSMAGVTDMDNGNSTGHMQHRHGLTKAEIRKNNKPIMEKKRRARINHCLNELKSLILDAMKKDPARHSKLEKADILEMTVKHLQDVQRQQIAFATLDPTVMHKFKTGFSDCADEVGNYIQRIDGIESGVKQRLITHLHSCINNMESSMAVGFGGGASNNLFGRGVKPFRGFGGLSQDVNNNGRMQVNGVQLIPSRLPTGELALVMPNSSNLPFFPQSFTPTNCFDLGTTSRQSAFNTVTKRPLVSPPLSPVSSLSSFDDHTNDFSASRTPPPQLPQQFGGSSSFINAFPTPPSGGSIGLPVLKPSFSIGQPHQQPFVSSTTPSTGVSMPQQQQIEVVKRTRWEMEAGEKQLLDTIKKEPSPLVVPPEKMRRLNESPSPAVANEEGHDNMWRPW